MAVLRKWERASNYNGKDFSDYYIVLSQTRDSDELEQSNFDVALDRLGGKSNTVIVELFKHWLCGWVEVILVHESDVEHCKIAQQILNDLEEYPALDEDDLYERRTDLCDDYYD
jgi:hypothetical protein